MKKLLSFALVALLSLVGLVACGGQAHAAPATAWTDSATGNVYNLAGVAQIYEAYPSSGSFAFSWPNNQTATISDAGGSKLAAIKATAYYSANFFTLANTWNGGAVDINFGWMSAISCASNTATVTLKVATTVTNTFTDAGCAVTGGL